MKRPLIAIGIELDWPLSHHYDVIRAVLREGQTLGWNCRVEPGLETSQEVCRLPAGYDGIIARASPALAACCRELGVPLVNVWANSKDDTAPKVQMNSETVGLHAARYLLARGFRNFGLVLREGDVMGERCAKGVESVLLREGLTCNRLYADMPIEETEWEAYRAGMGSWLAEAALPVAVIASDHIVARHFVDECLKRELLVPDDVAVISCQDSKLVCGGIEPTVTALAVSYEAVGSEAVAVMAQLLNGEQPPSSTRLVDGDLQIIERRSTDVRPVADRLVARALRYVWDHSHHPIAVPDVARAVGCGRRRLERRFRDTLGQSINDAITESRVERAKRILRDTDDPIKQVAPAAGFSSSARMAQVFAQRLGMSPSAYRNSLDSEARN